MRVHSRVVLLVALFAAVVADGSEAANATSEAADEDGDVQGCNSMLRYSQDQDTVRHQLYNNGCLFFFPLLSQDRLQCGFLWEKIMSSPFLSMLGLQGYPSG